MFEYTELDNHNDTIKIKFLSCEHIGYINKEHLKSGQFTCNKCSKLHNWDHLYDERKGLYCKSDVVRQCKACGISDNMSNLIAVKKNIQDGVQFWYYHNECLKSRGYNKSSIEDVINSSPLKVVNKTSDNFASIEGLCGIYAIYNNKTNKRYIGSSYNLSERLKQHISRLKNQKHHSFKLQEDYNIHNQPTFEFEVLEILDVNISECALYIIEQKYIDLFNSHENGYNVHPIAGHKGSLNDYYNFINKSKELSM